VVEQEPLLRLVRVGRQVPRARRLAMAFHVHTVPGSTASEYLAMQRTCPLRLDHIQPPSAMPAACAVRELMCR